MTPPADIARHSRQPLIARTLLILGVGASGIWIAIWLAMVHEPDLFRAKHEYTARFSQVAGLHAGSKVRYGGLDVGTVRAVTIDSADPTTLRVRFTVRANTPVRTDTRAAIPTLFTPLPVAYLSLAPGTRASPALPPGGEVPVTGDLSTQDALTLMSDIIQRGDTLVQALRPTEVRELMTALTRTVTRTDSMLTLVSEIAHRSSPELSRATQRVDSLLTRSNQLLAMLDSSRRDLGMAGHEAVATLQETHTLLQQVEAGMQEGGGLETLMRSLTVAGDHLARVSARLDRDPASVVVPPHPLAKSAGPSVGSS